jgi:predicted metal-dependent phosphotriesterase family hydrolase
MTTVETALGSLATAQLGPTFRAAGVTADQIEQMLVRNPRAIFEAAG